MRFQLAYSKNSEKIILREFELGQTNTSKIVDFNELKSNSIQGLLFSEDTKSEDLFIELEREIKFYPVRAAKEFNLSPDQFEKLNYDEAKKIFDRIRENWILQNNLITIEEIFKARNHLQGLWKNTRSDFFEELWFILKSNLGANSIRLYYNDIIKAKNENEKNRLIKVKVHGTRYPEPTTPDEADELVLKNYEKELIGPFSITEFNKEKGHLVMAGTIQKSPVLLMATIYQLTPVQKSLLIALFEGINQA